jgi:imidazoleglycerol phosphate synthase cyclase subunit
MSVVTRVIPCLDVAAGRVVKGVNFLDLRDAGDPVELARRYYEQGADEVTFLDVTATVEDRATMYETVTATAEQVFIPLTVGGGVRSNDDVARLLGSGADKVGVNSAAIARPALLGEIADRFGAQVLVLSLDVKRSSRTASGFVVTTHGGRTETELDALDWAKEAIERGAGELLVNSIDADGTKNGYDLELVAAVRQLSSVPVIASGGRLRSGGGGGCGRGVGSIRFPQRRVDRGRREGRFEGRRDRSAMTELTRETVGGVIERANFDANGLLPAIIQQHDSHEVLMLGYMDAEALRRTLTEGRVTFWSRSRQEYWRKGDTSGNVQLVRGAALDCDGDTLVVQVAQHGPACHTGAHACFDVDPLEPFVFTGPVTGIDIL